MNTELCWGYPNSRVPKIIMKNGDPGPPFSWGPQNFMTGTLTTELLGSGVWEDGISIGPHSKFQLCISLLKGWWD